MERARAGQNQKTKHWSRLANAACGLISRRLLKGDADGLSRANHFSAEQMRLADAARLRVSLAYGQAFTEQALTEQDV
jgi:hypothetical protein